MPCNDCDHTGGFFTLRGTVLFELREYAHGAFPAVLDEVTGDPRVRAKPVTRHGRTFLPLTRRPGGLQAFKLVLPVEDVAEPDLRTHEGYEWVYMLSGRLRLVLGTRDLLIGPGEAVEFDTRTPHWLANPGPTPAEALAIFGPQGERMHVRA